MSPLLAAALLAAAAPAPGAAAPAGLGLSAAPAHLRLVGAARATIVVRNPGRRPLVVQAAPAGFALTLRGRPRIERRGTAPGTWLTVRPRRLRVAPGHAAALTVAASPPRGASPGDHAALVVLTSLPRTVAAVRVRLRVGVPVVLHVRGRVVRRLRPLGLAVRRHGRRRVLELRLANRGNVDERLDGVRLRLVLARRGRRVASLAPGRRELLPGGVGLVDFVVPRGVRGPLAARVELRLRAGGPVLRRRSYRLLI
jgi:hypothetical protein